MFINQLTACLSAFIFVSIFLGACSNEGCTDESAVNYDVVADEDDGTCKYCDSTNFEAGQDSLFVVDDNSSSNHYGEVVAKFVITQKVLKYNHRECGDDKCSISYTIENLSNQHFGMVYHLYYAGIQSSEFIPLTAGHTSNAVGVSFVNNPCENIFPGSGNVTTGVIHYY